MVFILGLVVLAALPLIPALVRAEEQRIAESGLPPEECAELELHF